MTADLGGICGHVNLHVAAPVSASPEYWRGISTWEAPSLTNDDVADLLGTTAQATHKRLARDADFPEPSRRGRKNTWSASQIYSYIAERMPKRAAHVPRLWPDSAVSQRQSSVFVAAERWQGTATSAMNDPTKLAVVIHYWKPSGDRDDQIAVAYPASPVAISRIDAAAVAAMLAKQLFCDSDQTHTCALAMVSDDLRPIGANPHPQQPAVVVIEPGERLYPSTFAPTPSTIRSAGRALRADQPMTIAEIGWFDLGALLGTDLPWWPCPLRSLDTIAAWHPGCPPATVPIATREYSPSVITTAVNSAAGNPNAAEFGELIGRVQSGVEHQICRANAEGYQLPGGIEGPMSGIAQAAFPQFSHGSCVDAATLTTADLTRLLNYPATLPQATDIVALLALHEETRTVAAATAVAFVDSRGPLATEWTNRLQTAPEMSLGHHFVWTYSRMGTAHDGWTKPDPRTFTPLIDPLNPALWALRGDNGDIHYTVGTHVSTASGHLTELEVNDTRGFGAATFFRDSENTVWPLPLGSRSPLDPAALIHTVCSLRSDARRDGAEPGPDHRRNPALQRAFTGIPPWHLTPEELDAVLPLAAESHHPAQPVRSPE